MSKVLPADQLVAEAVKLGEKISSHSPLIVALCKEAVNAGMRVLSDSRFTSQIFQVVMIVIKICDRC